MFWFTYLGGSVLQSRFKAWRFQSCKFSDLKVQAYLLWKVWGFSGRGIAVAETFG